MAIPNASKTEVKVEKGDTLSQIALDYCGSVSKVQYLANLNNIANPNKIYIGQVIYLKKQSHNSSKSTANYPTVTGPGLLTTTKNELIAQWEWSKKSTTESYKVVWEYLLPDGQWYVGETKSISVDKEYLPASEYDMYTIPDKAVRVRFRVKPIAEKQEKASQTSSTSDDDDGGSFPWDSVTRKDGKGTTSTESTESPPKWTAEWSPVRHYVVDSLPITPSAPTVEIDEDNKLTASLENVEDGITHAQFEIVQNDTTSIKKSTKLAIKQKAVSFSYTVPAGQKYKVRCRLYNNKLDSDWSPFSANEPSMPAVPAKAPECRASGYDNDGYSVYLQWPAVNSAKTYDIEYTTKKEYFDNIGETTSVSTTDASTKLTIYKLQGGEYFFRVRATNTKGSSDWSEIGSVKIGEPPAAPTTWSSTTTAVVGEPLTLYWMHNSEDGSSQTWAQLELEVDGVKTTQEIKNTTDPDEKDKTSFVAIDTSQYSDGVQIKWRVATAGVTSQFGDWSIQRTVDIYAKPVLQLSMTDEFTVLEDGSIELIIPENGLMEELHSFPCYVKAVAGPENQTPVGYHLSVTANSTYDTVDEAGNDKTVTEGEQVYSKNFDISTPLLVELSAGNIDLENNKTYTVTCTVAMDSGLTAEAYQTFTVYWNEVQYHPNAEMSVNLDTYVTTIRPYCVNTTTVYRKVERSSGKYNVLEDTLDYETLENVYTETGETVHFGVNQYGSEIYYSIVYTETSSTPIYYRVTRNGDVYTLTGTKLSAASITSVRTETGERVMLGRTEENGTTVIYCEVEDETLINDVSLAVYRREVDDSFVEIATGLDNTASTYVIDPHPSLDYARYRVVATTKSTGAVGFYDLPGYYVGGKEVVIQWDETWSSFANWGEDPLSEAPWSGSLLKLPYNIDVSDSNSADVTQVKYIGRKRPVTYYGTQLGETATWNVTIPKDDKDTVYLLRRLSQWMGDVYVREPSGTGYWANIQVSFSQKHLDTTIPVTLSLTRVEGGI